MIVVTGATGNVGGELVRILVESGAQVTAVSRRPAQLPDGVRHVRADLADVDAADAADAAGRGALRTALEGAEALFLLVVGEDPQGILGLAAAAGVRRVVLLSSQGAGTRPEVYRHPARFEEAVRRSGFEWTILRSGGLNSNAFAWAGTIRAQGTAAAPFGDVGLPTVDPADVAGVAAAVLREDGHAGRTYDLTGPAPTTPRERAAAIGAATGTAVRFVEQTRAEARAQLLGFMPEPVVEGTLAILGRPLPAEQQVSPAVERILGRAPRTFADWAVRAAPAFR